MCRYFSHDVGAHYHRKIRRLRGALGWTGYGLYWAILELLREEDERGYVLPTDYNALKAAFGVPAKKLKSIVEDFGLFEVDSEQGLFYSPGLIERMKMVRSYRKGEAPSEPPTEAGEYPTEADEEADEERPKYTMSEAARAARKKGGSIGGKVYKPSEVNKNQTKKETKSEGEETKTKQKETKSENEETKTKQKGNKKESKTALRGGNIGGKGERVKEKNINPKQEFSPQSVSVSERVGAGAGPTPKAAGRAREGEPRASEAPSEGTASGASAAAEAQARASEAEQADEYYQWLAEAEEQARRTPSSPGGSGHTLVCALKEVYDQMRAENASWSPCKAITAEMLADAKESLAHYGTAEAIAELMKRATHLPFLQGKSNLQRLAWLLKLKTLAAIEEGAYTDRPTPPKPKASPRSGVAVPLTMTDDAKESLRKRFEANIIQSKTQ